MMGIDLLKAVRSDDKLKGLPFLMVTAEAEKASSKEQKPVSRNTLSNLSPSIRTSGDTVANERFADGIRALRETMWSFRKELDPSLVTMTSTNIPDALNKLEEVLKSSAEATRKVLTLVEQQDEIIAKGDTYLAELEASTSEHRADPDTLRTFIAQYRDLNERAREINLEMVMAHEFQDLCGQSITSQSDVDKLLEEHR